MTFNSLKGNPEKSHKPTSYRFSGKEYDKETGNYYYGARYYNPRLSIWLSVDPLAHYYPSHTPYNFVLNNPINLIDPTGMNAEDPGNGIGGFFDKLGNWLSGNGWEKSDDVWQGKNPDGSYTGEPAPPTELEDVTVIASGQSSGSGSTSPIGSGISIYGFGSGGVDNWNSGLNPLFSIDMTDPFWSALLGWGQKELYNNTIPGSEWSDDVKDLTKSLTDIYQTAKDMNEGAPVAPVPFDPKPTRRDSVYVRDKFIIQADGTKDTIPEGGDTIRFSTPLPYYQTIN